LLYFVSEVVFAAVLFFLPSFSHCFCNMLYMFMLLYCRFLDILQTPKFPNVIFLPRTRQNVYNILLTVCRLHYFCLKIRLTQFHLHCLLKLDYME
jgi:hypothetical protein